MFPLETRYKLPKLEIDAFGLLFVLSGGCFASPCKHFGLVILNNHQLFSTLSCKNIFIICIDSISQILVKKIQQMSCTYVKIETHRSNLTLCVCVNSRDYLGPFCEVRSFEDLRKGRRRSSIIHIKQRTVNEYE